MQSTNLISPPSRFLVSSSSAAAAAFVQHLCFYRRPAAPPPRIVHIDAYTKHHNYPRGLAVVLARPQRSRTLCFVRDRGMASEPTTYVSKLAAPLINPLTALPRELAELIFLHCVHPDYKEVVPSKKEAPLPLTHVCRHWREVAQSTPSLWCSITLYEVAHIDSAQLSLIGDWLNRSRDMPLPVKSLIPRADTTLYMRLSLRAD